MRLSKVTGLALFLAVILLMVVPLVNYLAAQAAAARAQPCKETLRHVAAGIAMYCQDYDEYYPIAARWTVDVTPYIKFSAIPPCPMDGAQKDSYALNVNVSGRPLHSIPNPAALPVLFESNLHAPNAAGGPNAAAAPGRHVDGNHYTFADATVRWLATPPGFGAPYVHPRVSGRGSDEP